MTTRLEDLRTFLTVLEHGSLTHAAEACALGQPALSKTLARLEREAGMPLLERTARGVAPTAAGLALAEHARRIVRAIGDMENDLRARRHARAGRVRLGVIPHLVSSLVSPLLASFFGSRPLASFSIETQLSARLLRMLEQGEIDLAVCATPDASPAALECALLQPLVIQIVAGAAHPRLERLGSLADLASERWVVPSASVLRRRLESHLAQAGLPPPSVAVESPGSPTAFTELVRHSELLGLMPAGALERPLGQGLVPLGFAGSSWQHELAVYWRRAAPLGPMARDFRDALLDSARAAARRTPQRRGDTSRT